MNESVQLESNPIIWSARDLWLFRAVGAVLGLIWGVLGIAIQAFILKGPIGPGLPEFPAVAGVCFGMMLGTGQVAGFWLVRRSQWVARGWLLEVLGYGLFCIALGILWGSVIVFVTLVVGTGFDFPIGALLLIPLFGGLLSVYSVLPAAILMAPIMVLVWYRTLERMSSRRGPLNERNPS
jgi:hypothetical protein